MSYSNTHVLGARVTVMDAQSYNNWELGYNYAILCKASSQLILLSSRRSEDCVFLLGTRLTDRFQTVVCTKSAVQPRFLGLWWEKAWNGMDKRLPKIVLFGQPSRSKRKAGRPRLGWEDVMKKNLREWKHSKFFKKAYRMNKFLYEKADLNFFDQLIKYYWSTSKINLSVFVQSRFV